MKKRNPNLRESYMDGEVLFRKYYEMGDAKSIPRLVQYVYGQTGTKPTDMGVWKSMWRWASLLENQRTAYRIYKECGGDLSWESWAADMRDVIRTAWQHPTEAKYQKFLRENGWT